MNIRAQASWWRPPLSQRDEAAAVTRGAALPFWALMAFTFVLLLSPQDFVPALAPLHLAFLSAALAGGVYVAGQLLRHQPVLQLTPETVLALALAGWSLVTIPLSYWPGGSLSFFFEIYFKALVVYWLLSNVVDSVSRLKTVAWILSLIAVPLSLAAVKSFFSGGFQSQVLSHGLDRIQGYGNSLTGNPNDLALMLNMILPLSIALLLLTRRPALRWLLGAVIGLDCIAIMASFSRGGFLTMGVIGAAYLCILFRRRQRVLAMAAVIGALLCIPFLPSAYLDRLGTITDIQADKTGSAQARLNDSLVAVEFVMEHPVAGAGIGMNILALNEARGATWTEVHNVYLEYASDLGLPGLIMFLLLLRAVVKGVNEVRRTPVTEPERFELHCLAEGLGVSLLGFIAAAFFYPDAYQFYFYYVAGLAVAARSIAAARMTRAEAQPEPAAA